jgi:hypothetical protein
MKAITPRSTAFLGSLLLVAAAALTGCAATGGATSSLATTHALATQAIPTRNSICTGGHASRFPQREAVGRVCTPAPSLSHAIY